jgi:D-alanine--poly(phosphoribitol) ligase subunit 2
MQEIEIKETVIKVLHNVIDSSEQIDEHKNLFDTQILDSLGFIQLLVALSDAFHIAISPAQVERTDLDTISKIVGFITNRLKVN